MRCRFLDDTRIALQLLVSDYQAPASYCAEPPPPLQLTVAASTISGQIMFCAKAEAVLMTKRGTYCYSWAHGYTVTREAESPPDQGVACVSHWVSTHTTHNQTTQRCINSSA
eukprot:6209329-Pleurochrysis_carterae.AAC.1